MNNMDYDAFLRAISLNPQKKVSFFLGAGASIESGVLSATDCILQWKKLIYDSNNPRSPFRQANFKADSSVKEVQRWIDAQRIYPSLEDEAEYSFFAEKAYPDEIDRGTYFSSIFSEISTVSAGYKLLSYFARNNFVDKIWTTNFDDLILKANTEQNISQIDVALDCIDRISNRINPNSAMVIKLHGDYKYTRMKNTSKELDAQEPLFVQALSELLIDMDLIVTGYSGRDNSIMNSLLTAFSKTGTGTSFSF